ncbi:MAG: Npt1/Npt2 family nucleotide transporter, partial [Deltaproteobacteria bacterium]|nr:Npt1/Npt2 family nucleotide transporter [Deltaproteobacteria bacterium]
MRQSESESQRAGGTGWRAVGLCAFFFLVIAAFWIQKPIRTSRFLSDVGPTWLPLVKLGTALLVLPAVLLYSSLAARYRRAALVNWCCAVFGAGSLLFWWLFSRGYAGTPALSYGYFFYLDIFNSVLVALFWSFANDLTPPDEARRTYGLVGAGGIVGGAVGSAITGWSVERLGAPNLLLVCAGLLGVIAALAQWLSRRAPAAEAADPAPRSGALAALREATHGARLTVASPYLLAIATLVSAYEVVSNLIDYQFNSAVAARYHDDVAIAAFLGRFSTAANLVALGVQLLLTSWILRRFGPRVGLLVLPLVLGAGSLGFLAVPLFGVIAATFFADAALGYSLNQSTKEVLYTPTDAATKYQAKAFIDMFLMRLAKALSSLLILAATAWWLPDAHAVHWLGGLGAAVAVGWIVVARRAARGFAEQTGDATAAA